MRKLVFVVFLGVMSMFSSCGEDVEPLYFVTVERDFDIPANLSTIPTHIFELQDVPTFYDEKLAVFNLSNDDVGDVLPGDASLTAVIEDLDWTFVDGMEVYLVSRVDATKRRRVFFTNQADFNNRKEVKMFNAFTDIKDVVSEGLIDLEVRINTREFVPQNIRARLIFNYAVFQTI